MVDLNNIKDFTTDKPGDWTVFGNAADFDALPQTHKEQILFLNEAATKYIFHFAANANLTTGGFWNPFEKGNFKNVTEFDDFSGTDENKQALKKWLFNRGIPFSNWVFVLTEANTPPMLTTWKMLVKYSDLIFYADDVMVFDKTLNWCLVYFHEDHMFFGKDKNYDPTEDEQRMQQLNDQKQKHPKFRHPYL